jgi:hypothetical protein
MPPDRDAPDHVRRRTLTRHGWTTRPVRRRSGGSVDRWFGPAPIDQQPRFGLSLTGAWVYHCAAVAYGKIKELPDA